MMTLKYPASFSRLSVGSQTHLLLVGGRLVAALNLIGGLVPLYTHSIKRMLGNNVYIVFFVAVVLSLLFLGNIHSVYLFGLWGIFSIVFVLLPIIISEDVLGIVSSSRGATVLSGMDIVRRFVSACIVPILGVITDRTGTLVSLSIIGCIIFVLCGGLVVCQKSFMRFNGKSL